ncbi:MAG: AraC family transcriptional regulator [Propionivibrio sp.]
MATTAKQLHADYVTGKRIDTCFGKFRLVSKIGSYCEFGYDQISNQRHHHDCYELCIVVSGKGSYFYDNSLNGIKEGDIIIADPGVRHEIQASAKDNLILLYIFISIDIIARPANTGSFGEACIEGFLRGHQRQVSRTHLLSYIQFLENYNASSNASQFGTYESLKNLVLECLDALSLTSNTPAQDSVGNVFEKALDYIDSNLHTRISASGVAAYSCTTLRNLEYIFRKQLQKTIIRYIKEKKAELACHYLSIGFSVSDAAEMVGIFNLSQFSTMFKTIKNVSPKEYRDMFVNDRQGMGRRL